MAVNLSFFIFFVLMATSAIAQAPGAAPAASPKISLVVVTPSVPRFPGVPTKAPSPIQSSVSSPFATASVPALAPTSSPPVPPTSVPSSVPPAGSDTIPPSTIRGTSNSAPSAPPVNNGAFMNKIAVGGSVAAVAIAVTLLL